MIRKATFSEQPQLLKGVEAFVTQSALPLSFNEDQAWRTLAGMITRPDVDFLIAIEGVRVKGAAIVTYENLFYDEPMAFLQEFLVYEEFSDLAIADDLIQGALDAMAARNVKVMLASATVCLGRKFERFQSRVLKRHGFKVLGKVMVRNTDG